MDQSPGQLQTAFSRSFQNLSPQLQQAARYVLENPADVATHSLRQIAQRSGLTPPTFSRLARAIGFDEYESLRDVCRSELKRQTMSLAERALVTQGHTGVANKGNGSFAELHASSSIDNISQLMERIDLKQLAEVADSLAQAKSIGLIGAQSSKAVLEYFHHMMSFANPGWAIINDDHLSTPAFLEKIDSSSAILIVSIQPYIRRTVDVAELVSRNDPLIITITDDISSPTLKYSKHSFLVPTESPQFFPSYVAVLTLLEILTGMLVRRWGEKANKHIDSIERTSHAIGDYI